MLCSTMNFAPSETNLWPKDYSIINMKMTLYSGYWSQHGGTAVKVKGPIGGYLLHLCFSHVYSKWVFSMYSFVHVPSKR